MPDIKTVLPKPPWTLPLVFSFQSKKVLSYLIFVTNITNEICGEQFVMWRNFKFICMTDVEKSEISPLVE